MQLYCISVCVCLYVLHLLCAVDTDNELASHEGGYDNISVPYLPSNPNLDLLKFISQVKPGDVSADCILSPLGGLHIIPPLV